MDSCIGPTYEIIYVAVDLIALMFPSFAYLVEVEDESCIIRFLVYKRVRIWIVANNS